MTDSGKGGGGGGRDGVTEEFRHRIGERAGNHSEALYQLGIIIVLTTNLVK